MVYSSADKGEKVRTSTLLFHQKQGVVGLFSSLLHSQRNCQQHLNINAKLP